MRRMHAKTWLRSESVHGGQKKRKKKGFHRNPLTKPKIYRIIKFLDFPEMWMNVYRTLLWCIRIETVNPEQTSDSRHQKWRHRPQNARLCCRDVFNVIVMVTHYFVRNICIERVNGTSQNENPCTDTGGEGEHILISPSSSHDAK